MRDTCSDAPGAKVADFVEEVGRSLRREMSEDGGREGEREKDQNLEGGPCAVLRGVQGEVECSA